MKKMTRLGLAALAAATAVGVAAPASNAATGGGHLESNPGIVALMDDNGNHLCSGVLVDQQWVLTDEGSMPCSGASAVTGELFNDAVEIDDVRLPHKAEGIDGNDPTKSGAMLLHLAKPVKDVAPAQLSDDHPHKGDRLSIVSFNGPEGINHTLSIGKGTVVAKNHNDWASYYGKPSGMTLEGPVDNGSLIMRGDKVVGFTQVANPRGSNAEDISHIHEWINKTISSR